MINKKSFRQSILVPACAVLLASITAQAAQLSFAWDSPTTNLDGSALTDLTGHRVYYGLSSRSYSAATNVGVDCAATISGLDPTGTYYFAVTAVNSLAEESPLSDELIWTSDSDGDKLPDAWERIFFGSTSSTDAFALADSDGDGACNIEEYVAGTSPTDKDDSPDLQCRFEDGFLLVSFDARDASGAAYDGYTRYYTVERTSSLTPAAWAPVPNFVNIPAAGQSIVHVTDASDDRLFYRTKIWLQ